ncbi:MAG: methionyl-tRNA formyltransferase [Deltaproteobacteria bacterium]|nr:methionyl-tRNA formyltransferase [Deltaproteobacteria bacterium]
MSKPKILFMGTPDFSVPSLKMLISHGHSIVGVMTQPDRPKGRGQTVSPTPVKVVGEHHHLTVFQPDKLRSPECLDLFRTLSPDLVIVAAFGQVLPREMIEGPGMGCINVHPSLLPKYRGAAPINWSLIRGETKTGVTIMLMDEGLDTGDILTQEKTMIGPDETFGMLYDRLAKMGAELLLKTIELMQHGAVRRISQDASAATYAPRLKKEDGLIRWDSGVDGIVNLVRGLSPVPGAYTFFRGKKMKVFSATGEVAPVRGKVGEIGRKRGKGLPVTARNGFVFLKDVQLENKKRMSVHDFLRGSPVSSGDTLG